MGVELDRGVCDEIIGQTISEIHREREAQIIKALKDRGYDFQDRNELEFFAKTRCQVISFMNSSRKILAVDGKPICEWWDTFRLERDENKFTYIVGEKP